MKNLLILIILFAVGCGESVQKKTAELEKKVIKPAVATASDTVKATQSEEQVERPRMPFAQLKRGILNNNYAAFYDLAPGTSKKKIGCIFETTSA